MGDQPSITRRGVLVGAGAVAGMFAVGGVAYALEGEDRGLLRPPGAQDEAHFRATCLKCNRCETACPQRCLRTGVLEDGVLNWRTPIMDFHRGVCDFCGVCEDVCPAGSIAGAHDPAQVIGIAVVDRDLASPTKPDFPGFLFCFLFGDYRCDYIDDQNHERKKLNRPCPPSV